MRSKIWSSGANMVPTLFSTSEPGKLDSTLRFAFVKFLHVRRQQGLQVSSQRGQTFLVFFLVCAGGQLLHLREKIVFLLHKPCEIVNVFLAMASFIVASGEIFVISLQNANFCVDAVLGGDDLSGRFRWLCGVSGRHGAPPAKMDTVRAADVATLTATVTA